MTKKQHEIIIGGYYASREPMVLRTLLGSCVAVCLHDPQRKIGGMNHILLPGSTGLKHFDQPGRFGGNAMEMLINKVISLGARKKALTAKIFGGSLTIATIGDQVGPGPKNVAFVKKFLAVESIELLKENTGGTDTRRIFFHTDSGDVYLRRTPSSLSHHSSSLACYGELTADGFHQEKTRERSPFIRSTTPWRIEKFPTPNI